MNGQLATYTEETLPSNALVSEIEIVAKYTNGEPMSGGYVRVFAPDDRTTPWLTGNCDRQGRFTFTPDRSKTGRWTIRVQAADHSNFINILVR
jgi:nickel transport protein